MNINERGYYDIGRPGIMAIVRGIIPPAEADLVELAYQLAKSGHRTQVRADKSIRYFEHPKSVFMILLHELKITDWRILVLALLHDVREDTHLLTAKAVEALFGSDVAQWLEMLTVTPENESMYAEVILEYGSVPVWLVKLADRLHNLRTLGVMPLEKRRRKVLETRTKYIPIANKLSMALVVEGRYLKNEIELWCERHEKAAA